MGKRMHSALPKVLHAARAAGRSSRTSSTLRARWARRRSASSSATGGERRPRGARGARRRASRCRIRRAAPATPCASRSPTLPADGVTLVVIGDVPLVPADALGGLVARSRVRGKLARAHGATLPIPPGSDASCAMRKAACARSSRSAMPSPQQRAIDEINTGVIAAPDRALKQAGCAALERGQRAGRVLPHRRRRDGGGRRRRGRRARRGGRRATCAASTTARSSPRSSACCRGGVPRR